MNSLSIEYSISAAFYWEQLQATKQRSIIKCNEKLTYAEVTKL